MKTVQNTERYGVARLGLATAAALIIVGAHSVWAQGGSDRGGAIRRARELECASAGSSAGYFRTFEVMANVESPRVLRAVKSLAYRGRGEVDTFLSDATVRAQSIGGALVFDVNSPGAWGSAELEMPRDFAARLEASSTSQRFKAKVRYSEVDGEYRYSETFPMNCTLQ